MSKVILVTGPARSGKSEWAETPAMQAGKSVIYVAQVDPADSDWLFALEHRCRRPREVTLEVPDLTVWKLSKPPPHLPPG